MQNNHEATLPDIQKTVIFDAPIQRVWDAVATSQGIAAWFMPNNFEPKMGYEFHLQSPFGPSPCKVLELDPPKRLVFSWDVFGWVVKFELKDMGDKTEFTLVHAGWGKPDDLVPGAKETFAVIRNRMNNGWEPLVNEKLRKVVEA
ncbi:SRPBCC domain-containing protein [Bacillus sp. V3-13]|uniref:SRPBCC family protein n=1 Tax=Bacillus sp. V3-13 TaxID=2053728 RepID=UPI000C771F16|nr:SRPBCC domain-containing protein [Bacillus sp. V3-13]PLR76677.1 SRPBCC domain-containing protein [Bacillus sp. V3-13]